MDGSGWNPGSTGFRIVRCPVPSSPRGETPGLAIVMRNLPLVPASAGVGTGLVLQGEMVVGRAAPCQQLTERVRKYRTALAVVCGVPRPGDVRAIGRGCVGDPIATRSETSGAGPG